ncbi:MAG: hypothetical protein BEN19_01270 [Epulopiscium sp. Nuni2H_MBin003]|nr:MAG: hypothetical protein BEN19_01270 [Epulopiscium sp. Nuni2H_MBin003]
MIDNRICTNLKYNIFQRDNDTDVFLDTNHMVIDCYLPDTGNQRIQFVSPRAVLIRLGNFSEKITVHILSDMDIYSSIANFEIDLKATRIYIHSDEQKVILKRAI